MSVARARADAAENRLHAARISLATGTPSIFDLTEEDLAFTALGDLVLVLRAGCPGQATLDMLAAFVENISMVQVRAPPAKRTAVANLNIALRLLGCPRTGGRLLQDYARQRAIATFELYAGEGRAEQEALIEAYNAYWGAMNSSRTYSIDRKRLSAVTVGADLVPSNEADRFIHGELRRWLRKAGVVAEMKRGRKAKPVQKIGS